MKNTKFQKIYFRDIIESKTFTVLNFSIKNPCISQNILPNYNGKETPAVKETMMKIDLMKKNVT